MTSAKDISVYKAEQIAISEALSWLSDNLETTRVNIYSDSKSAVDCLNGHLTGDEMTKEAMLKFKELNKMTYTEIKWIKGHSENTGNEYADMLAKKRAYEARLLQDTKPHWPVTYKEIKKWIHKFTLDRWQCQWETTPGCRVSKLFYPSVRESNKITKMKIKELQAISQMITGHGLFKRHLMHWKELSDFQCQLCGEAEEDSWHLWEWCPRLNKERKIINEQMLQGLPYEHGILRLMKVKELRELWALYEAIVTI